MRDDFDLDYFLSLPRVAGLSISPDGRSLVTTVSRPDADGTRFTTALWEIDPQGRRGPRRLTRAARGESDPVHAPDGAILFRSARPDPDAVTRDKAVADDREVTGLWRLPPGGGEAHLLAAPHGGVDAVAVAHDAGTLVLGTFLHPTANGWRADAEHEEARRKAGVTAGLARGYPIRYWDHDLGPRERRLAVLPGSDDPRAFDPHADLDEPLVLAADAGRALDEVTFAVTPDGTSVVTGWQRDAADPARARVDLDVIEIATGRRRTLRSDGGEHHHVTASPQPGSPSTRSGSPAGGVVACVREDHGTPDRAPSFTLVLVDVSSGTARILLDDPDLWPQSLAWAADGRALYLTADHDGRTLPFRVEVQDGSVTRLATEGTFTDLCPSPDGAALYALRSTVATPPVAIVLDAVEPDQDPRVLPTPGDMIGAVQGPSAPLNTRSVRGPSAPLNTRAVRGPSAPLNTRAVRGPSAPLTIWPPGEVTRMATEAADGTRIGAWLVAPPGASAERPAPLLVMAHGGPYSSWSGWHWRWNPHVFAAQGWAVLLPDPAPSTGYGRSFVQRGWGRWGPVTEGDLLAALNATVARPEVDAERVALAGGSYGGYVANWMAGHSDRFSAIVTHASLWSLRAFHGTTDVGVAWEHEFGDPYADPSRYAAASPDSAVAGVRAPVLVIHGERDFRVPYGEGLALYTDLTRHGVDVSFLRFPDEGHWVLRPQHARIWYATVLAFLDHHVRGAPWAPPPLL